MSISILAFLDYLEQFRLFESVNPLYCSQAKVLFSPDSLLKYSPLAPYLLVVVVLTFIILYFSYMFVKQAPNMQKLSPYECGFEPFDSTKNQFDIKFFMIAILFIIFDIEVVLVLFWSTSLSKIELLSFWSVLEFLIEVGLALFYVWFLRVLEW